MDFLSQEKSCSSKGFTLQFPPAQRIFAVLLTILLREMAYGQSFSPPDILSNGGFETGTAPWVFYSNSGGSFTSVSPGQIGQKAARIFVNAAGNNIQLEQHGFTLLANTRYRLTFSANSSQGHDVSVFLHKNSAPYTNYGLNGFLANLSTAWQTFTIEFTSAGFTGTTTDIRLRFWLSGYAAAADIYFIDNVVLEAVTSSLPVITVHPSNKTVVEGQSASFSVAATGVAPLSYQWQKNGQDIPGATNTSFNTLPVPLSDNGSTFRCVVTNSAGYTLSNLATLIVNPPPSPSPNSIVNPGFESGTAPWTFFTDGSGSFASVSPGFAGSQSVKLSVVTQGSNVQLYQSALNLEANTSYTLTFSAYSNSGHDLSIFLHKQNSPFTNYGINNSVFNLTPSWGTYTLAFTTIGFPGIVNDARLRFWFAPYDAAGDMYFIDDVSLMKTVVTSVPPAITTQPASQMIPIGQPATFTIRASSTTALGYQWQRNGVTIPNAADSNLVVPATTMADSGAVFRCQVSNSGGTVMSSGAILSVRGVAPDFTLHPSSLSEGLGQVATFSVVAVGTTPLFLQWQRNGSNITGAIGASFTLSGISAQDDSARFRCVAINSSGRDTSNEAMLRVNIPSSILFHPQSQNIVEGDSASFHIEATGTTPLMYQWVKNSSLIIGATSPSYATSAVNLSESGSVFRCIVTNLFGSDTSEGAALVVIPTPPTLIGQTTSQVILVGQPAFFAVSALSTAPLSYQWQRNSIAIPNAVDSTLLIPATTMADSGTVFRCMVSNAGGTVTSNGAVLSVQGIAPTVISNPSNLSLELGQDAQFSVVAVGTIPMFFQWQRNRSNVAGATAASFTVVGVSSTDDSSRFRCIVINSSGRDTSSEAMLMVHVPASITLHPQSQNIVEGGTAIFQIEATGTTPLMYQWISNSVLIDGATGPSYAIPLVNLSSNGLVFRCIVTNQLGSDTSGGATLIVIPTPPIITEQPASQTIFIGQPAVFTVSASSTTPLAYQWQRNSTPIPDATDFTYEIAATAPTDNGVVFQCLVSNAGGTVLSSGAVLSIGGIAPIVTLDPMDVNLELGQDATFRISVAGSAPISFQWQKNGSDIPGAIDTAVTVHNISTADNSTRFRCIASNSSGSDTSSEAILAVIVTVLPSITSHPQSQNIIGGSSATFHVEATSTGPLSYQWQKNGANINGATSGYYTTPPATLTDSGALFRCIVSNPGGSITSTAAILHVGNPPSISLHPVNHTVREGMSAAFSITAWGSDSISYQWKRNNVVIPGALSPSYTTPPTSLSDDGALYRCIVTSPYGIATSTQAALFVDPPVLTLNSWQRSLVDSTRPSRAVFIASADLDGDGYKDIVTGACWYKNPGPFASAWIRTAIGSPLTNMAAVRDFDDDGDMDILGTAGPDNYTNEVAEPRPFAWARNEGNGTFTVLANIPNATGNFLQGTAVERYQSGAPMDVALSWQVKGVGVQMYQVPANPSTQQWTWRTIATPSQGEALSSGDIDNDGDHDLLLGTKWLRNGGNDWTSFVLFASGAEVDRNRLADINEDGKLDAVVMYQAESIAGKIAWYQQGPSSTDPWTEHIVDYIIGPMSLDVVDMDRDGDLDIVVGEHNLNAPSTARMLVYENVDGAGTSWAQHLVYTGDEHHDGAQVVDIDQDGDFDIISIGWSHNRVVTYENNAINRVPNIIPASIVQHPPGQAVAAGDAASFSVSAGGATPITYQWQREDIDIAGATFPSYTVSFSTPADSGARFRCVVSNPAGADTSLDALLRVISQPPGILVHPASRIAAEGEEVAFNVAASGTRPLTYQWQRNDVDIPGAYGISYATPPLTWADDGAVFRCIVSNTAGKDTTDVAVLTLGLLPPTIIAHPSNKSLLANQTALFSVAATGSAPLVYQWQLNGIDVNTANGPSYTTDPLSLSNTGERYRCIVSNSIGSDTSQEALITVSPIPVVSLDVPFRHVMIDSSAAKPSNPHCKAVGDIDGDGFPDVLAASSTGFTEGLFWYRYPTWTRFSIHEGSFSTDMKVGDVDGDGDLDVIIPKGDDYGFSVWWYENPIPAGDPATTLWTEHFVGGAGAHDVVAGDVNQDGKLDIVVRVGTETSLFTQDLFDAWTKTIIGSEEFEGTALGDIDLDNDLDVVINGYWLENPLPNGNPVEGYWVSHAIDSTWPVKAKVQVADFNGDGFLEVLLAPSETASGKLSWFESSTPSTGPWTEHIIDSPVSFVHSILVADMNLDGKLDVITAEMHQSTDPDEVNVYLNRDSAFSWYRQTIATSGSHNMTIADIGNDGDIDIVGANWDNSASNGAPIEMWENMLHVPVLSLSQWQRHTVDSQKPYRSVFVDAKDVDGDGFSDIIMGGWWYRNPGSPGGNWTRTTVGSPMNQMAAVYDFDADGDHDILGTQGIGDASNSRFAWARNEGGGVFTILTNVSDGNGTILQGETIARFRPDSALQVILSWNNDPTVGVQALTVPANPSTSPWTWSVISPLTLGEGLDNADLDGDGDHDIILGTAWLRNEGTSWTPFTLHIENEQDRLPDRVHLADMDGDGDLDVVIGYSHDLAGKLAWYEHPIDPTGFWSEHLIKMLPGTVSVHGFNSVSVVDMDGDGDLDVVGGEHSNPATGSEKLFVFENTDGRGFAWSEHLVDQGEEHHDGALAVDIDGDGDIDIISLGWMHPRVFIYENLAITHAPLSPPHITMHPQGVVVPPGSPAAFTVAASGTQPLSYRWQRNGVNIAGATNPSYTLATTTAQDSGTLFRCVVSNPLGVVMSSAVLLRTTTAANPSGIASDDFSANQFNTSLWSFINPLNDASFALIGAGTPDALASVFIPPGSSHDLWTGTNLAPRLRQSAANADFEIEAKFQAPLTSQYQFEGILIEQDQQNLIRFDFVKDNSGLRVFCATFTNGVPTVRKSSGITHGNPLYLRVRRQGDQWTHMYSYNSITWTTAVTFNHILAVHSVGPFFGNHGIPTTTSPAFSPLMDYFFNTASPITHEDSSLVLAKAGTSGLVLGMNQNYPNPFNPTTHITYTLPKPCHVRLEIFNLLGQRVAQLVDGVVAAGYHNETFDASALSSGLYFYRLTAQGTDGVVFSKTEKMLLTK